jgi:hypothetical protein
VALSDWYASRATGSICRSRRSALALLRVGSDAAALAGYLGFCFAIFQHLNVRTPHWIGFFVQRPEGHSVHHERGLHAYNYGNIALFDQLFGTYRNPQTFSEVQGFWDGASQCVGAMLIGRDVGEPGGRLPAKLGYTVR